MAEGKMADDEREVRMAVNEEKRRGRSNEIANHRCLGLLVLRYGASGD